jgi:hypothetical protein
MLNKGESMTPTKMNSYAATAARPGAVADVANAKAGIVDDLRKRLQQAEKDLADAKIRLAGH